MGEAESVNLSELPRGTVFALLLIIAGAVLFLDNIGVVPIQDIQAYWPIFIVFWGASMLERWKSPIQVIWGFGFIAWGVLLILGNLHILHVSGSVFWPIALIVFGLSMLVRPVNFRQWHERHREWHEKHRENIREWHERHRAEFARTGFARSRESFFGNKLHETAVFSSINRRVQSQQFEGGKVEAVFGSVTLDLTEAAISTPDRRAILDVAAVFGGAEILAPRTWRVQMKTAAVLGGCDDRTIPPRPEPGIEPPTLVVTGAAVFGGIEIRN